MKKIITFCFFAFALVIGTQNVLAQNKLEINKEANEKAYELRKQLKFSTLDIATLKLGDTLSNPKTVLTWVMTIMNAPVYLIYHEPYRPVPEFS